MWVFTSNGFISAVKHRDIQDHLMVRARKLDHLQAIFPGIEVSQIASSDYKYRVTIHKDLFSATVDKLVQGLEYDNFKNSIPDHEYHDACSQVWKVMHSIQPGSYMPKAHPELFDDDENQEDLWLKDFPDEPLRCHVCQIEIPLGDSCTDCYPMGLS